MTKFTGPPKYCYSSKQTGNCSGPPHLQVALSLGERGLLAAVDGAVDAQEGHVLAGRGAVLAARLVDLQEGVRQVALARRRRWGSHNK